MGNRRWRTTRSRWRPTRKRGWRREYGGLRIDQAKRLKESQRENARLRRLVADQALDNAILRQVASGQC